MEYYPIMDEKDASILEELRQDSKRTTQQISRKTGIPVTTVHNRIKRLEEEGIIRGYSVELDHEKLGRPIPALILVSVNYTLPSGKHVTQEAVGKAIKRLGADEVMIVTGGSDILVRYRAESIQDLNSFVVERLRTVQGVDKTQTMIVLNTI